MKISYKRLRLLGVIYAVLPIIVFYAGWLALAAALIFSAAAVSGCFFFSRSSDDGEYPSVHISGGKIIAVAAIALVWCFLAGQGGFIHQSADNIIRNAIFRDMIRLPWPVVYDGDQLLSYYIAQWIIPAAIGKAVLAFTGSEGAAFLAGRIALLIWSTIGIFIALLLVSVITAKNQKAKVLLPSLMLIFFSGLDILGLLISNGENGEHIEWWAEFAQFSSFTTCLFWVYNQFIVILIITLCLIHEKTPMNFAFLGILILPYGPFPFMGIVMICIIKAMVFLTGEYRKGKLSEGIKTTLSLQNIIMLLAVGIPFGLYYMSNAIISNDIYREGENLNTGFRFHAELSGYISDGNTEGIAMFLARYLLFIILEAGLYFIIIMLYHQRTHRRDMTFILSSATLLFIPLFQIGTAYDFSMRVSIPALIYICVELIRVVNEDISSDEALKDPRKFMNAKNAKPVLTTALLIFCIGAVTAFIEFNREITNTIFFGAENETSSSYIYSMNDYSSKENFVAVGYKNSLFYKYLLKK